MAGLTLAVWLFVPGRMRLWLGVTCLVLLALVLNFYRDPNRVDPGGHESRVLSPADGRVVHVATEAGTLQISIFLSAFDVHVNRAPVAGRVVSLEHSPGRYLPAFKPESSTSNERVCLQLQSETAGTVRCTQVAGLLARRIDNWIDVGQHLERGERYGMIHLGSRVDLELDDSFEPLVARGSYVKGGQSILAERKNG